VGGRRRSLALALAVLSAHASACGEAPSRRQAGPRNAVLIVLDTVRADHLSAAGYERPTTPTLDALAANGVVFEQAISYSPWTLPSLVATLSGSWAGRQGVFRSGRLQRSLVETIRDAGFATAAVTEGAFVSRDFGFDLGFDHYREEEGSVQRLLPGEARDDRAGGSIERTFERAGQWLRGNAHTRFFLMIHSYEPHAPYLRRSFTEGLEPGAVGETFTPVALPLLRAGRLRFDASDLEYLRALYDGGILESDRQIGRLMRVLDELDLARDTLLVVSSDHGEALGERNPMNAGDHGHSLYDELLRVPLVIVDPTEEPAVRRVPVQVRTIDILPTIADLLGVELPKPSASAEASQIDGRSLAPLMRAEDSKARIAFGGATRALPARSFVRHEGYKYIETRSGSDLDPLRPAPPPRQLYDLSSDPGERTNLVKSSPEIAARLQERLHEHLESQRGEAPQPVRDAIPNALRQRLESLGYLE
jgi:arylsulfatase A-like enzyme